MYLRKAVVSGHFYPSRQEELLAVLRKMTDSSGRKEKALSVIAPHAGYIYSGAVAGKVFGSIEIPASVILLGPNHTGFGEPFAIETEGAWETPLGSVPIDTGLARLVLKQSAYLQEDHLAFQREHSIEVQLPFLQYLRRDVMIVPILLGSVAVNSLVWQEIAAALVAGIKESGDEALIVASSDFTHYQPQKEAEENDRAVIEAIEMLDPDLTVERIEELQLSMCGYGPVLTAMIASKSLGARKGMLLEYRTSGDVSKEYDSVVGYAGMVIV